MRKSPLLADFIHTRACKPICAKLLTLPLLLGANAIWLAMPITEAAVAFLVVFLMCRYTRDLSGGKALG